MKWIKVCSCEDSYPIIVYGKIVTEMEIDSNDSLLSTYVQRTMIVCQSCNTAYRPKIEGEDIS